MTTGYNTSYTGVPGEIKRRELDPQVSPEEIMSREVELGCESWTSFASGCYSTAVRRTLSLWLSPARQLKQQLCCALVAGQWRGDTALTLPLFWRWSTVSPVFFGRYPRSSLHSFFHSPPPPPPPVPNKQPRFCGRKAKKLWSNTSTRIGTTWYRFRQYEIETEECAWWRTRGRRNENKTS